ncbi:hypothetical protein AURDEDRAFT_125917 [Auricularia subglabra TFB-10046 SS5]|nr:hypothetical protein AURDEDRAFT_125917 [Auricularia subglabra TFB-10046 SS5]
MTTLQRGVARTASAALSRPAATHAAPPALADVQAVCVARRAARTPRPLTHVGCVSGRRRFESGAGRRCAATAVRAGRRTRCARRLPAAPIERLAARDAAGGRPGARQALAAADARPMRKRPPGFDSGNRTRPGALALARASRIPATLRLPAVPAVPAAAAFRRSGGRRKALPSLALVPPPRPAPPALPRHQPVAAHPPFRLQRRPSPLPTKPIEKLP